MRPARLWKLRSWLLPYIKWEAYSSWTGCRALYDATQQKWGCPARQAHTPRQSPGCRSRADHSQGHVLHGARGDVCPCMGGSVKPAEPPCLPQQNIQGGQPLVSTFDTVQCVNGAEACPRPAVQVVGTAGLCVATHHHVGRPLVIERLTSTQQQQQRWAHLARQAHTIPYTWAP